MITEVVDIQHVYYINLEHREDRLKHVQEQLSALGLGGVSARFNAIKMKNGAIGCSMSHLSLLEMAVKKKLPHILIVEDDILFLDVDLFKSQFKKTMKELEREESWDVVLFSGNNIGNYRKVVVKKNVNNGKTNENVVAIQVSLCQTTTGYLVNGPYISVLAQNVREGVKKLMSEPKNKRDYAIDRYWFHLQMRELSRWFLIMPVCVIQKEGYSDIEERDTNYTHLLLDVDKEWLKRRKKII
jgi:glycosyl transferase family 25